MRILITMMLLLTLSGCLGSRVDFSDLGTAAGAVVGAGASAAVGLPPLGIAVGTAGGAAAGAVLVDEPESQADKIAQLPEEERATALKWLAVWETIRDLGYYAIAAVLAFFLIPVLIGYFLPNGKQRRQKKEMIKIKEMLFDRPDIQMKDLK